MHQAHDPAAAPTVIRWSGDLDAQTSPELRARLREHLDAGRCWLIVELSGVSFIDSSGLSALVAGLKAARLQGGQMVLAGLQEPVSLVFRITQAITLFEIVPSEQEAREVLARMAAK